MTVALSLSAQKRDQNYQTYDALRAPRYTTPDQSKLLPLHCVGSDCRLRPCVGRWVAGIYRACSRRLAIRRALRATRLYCLNVACRNGRPRYGENFADIIGKHFAVGLGVAWQRTLLIP